jgi:tripartite-type tricarboxylate transporter receptor subunit TctC
MRSSLFFLWLNATSHWQRIKMKPHTLLMLAVASSLTTLAFTGAQAQSATSIAAGKPIKILVGVTPGGTTDALARFLAQEMSKELGQPVLLENRAGDGGNIATEAVAKSAPDGLTLLFCSTSQSVNPGLDGAKLPFDAIKDFTPITQVSTGPAVLIASNDFPGKTAKDVINMA